MWLGILFVSAGVGLVCLWCAIWVIAVAAAAVALVVLQLEACLGNNVALAKAAMAAAERQVDEFFAVAMQSLAIKTCAHHRRCREGEPPLSLR